jgi:hypothetical protein
MIEPNHFEIPPWKSPGIWSQVISALEHTVRNQRTGLDEARELSALIDKEYAKVNDALDTVCKATCSSCLDTCCKKATVWYDFKDLLYIYLHSGQFPGEQLRKKSDLTCCNLTPMGCRLHRSERPFVCTWYICPSQAAMMSEKSREQATLLVRSSIQEIKSLRKRLEDIFVEVISS